MTSSSLLVESPRTIVSAFVSNAANPKRLRVISAGVAVHCL